MENNDSGSTGAVASSFFHSSATPLELQLVLQAAIFTIHFLRCCVAFLVTVRQNERKKGRKRGSLSCSNSKLTTKSKMIRAGIDLAQWCARALLTSTSRLKTTILPPLSPAARNSPSSLKSMLDIVSAEKERKTERCISSTLHSLCINQERQSTREKSTFLPSTFSSSNEPFICDKYH